MNELIQKIVDQSGISEESATQAVNAVIDYVKQHAPAPIASQLETYLTDDTAASVVGSAGGMLGGLFKKRDAD
jgi:nucleoid DNA-binding protein